MQCYLLESPVANGQPLLATVVGHEGVAVGMADTPTLLALVSCSKQIRSCVCMFSVAVGVAVGMADTPTLALVSCSKQIRSCVMFSVAVGVADTPTLLALVSCSK